MLISAVILIKNEENNIVDCIETVDFCDEIIIIDDNSTDRTKEIVLNLKNPKIKIFSRRLDGDFSSQRNFGLEKAKSDWILFVDADERIPVELKEEILHHIKNNKDKNGFLIRRLDFMWGQSLKHGETGNIKLLRLGKKNSGIWQGNVHEVWKIKPPIGELKNPLFHYPHPTIKEFLSDINFYTELRAKELFSKKTKTNLLLILSYPLAKFLQNYLLKLGFLDGLPGFVFAILMSFHSFLVRAKLWLLWQKTLQK
jgi:glycosyltransferase involved in cell wall biosynthesis